MKPTKEDREAVWKAFYAATELPKPGEWNRHELRWLEDGTPPPPHRACADRVVQLQDLVDLLVNQRAALLDLAARVAVKVGEHEYKRGVYTAGRVYGPK